MFPADVIFKILNPYNSPRRAPRRLHPSHSTAHRHRRRRRPPPPRSRARRSLAAAPGPSIRPRPVKTLDQSRDTHRVPTVHRVQNPSSYRLPTVSRPRELSPDALSSSRASRPRHSRSRCPVGLFIHVTLASTTSPTRTGRSNSDILNVVGPLTPVTAVATPFRASTATIFRSNDFTLKVRHERVRPRGVVVRERAREANETRDRSIARVVDVVDGATEAEARARRRAVAANITSRRVRLRVDDWGAPHRRARGLLESARERFRGTDDDDDARDDRDGAERDDEDDEGDERMIPIARVGETSRNI